MRRGRRQKLRGGERKEVVGRLVCMRTMVHRIKAKTKIAVALRSEQQIGSRKQQGSLQARLFPALFTAVLVGKFPARLQTVPYFMLPAGLQTARYFVFPYILPARLQYTRYFLFSYISEGIFVFVANLSLIFLKSC